MKNILQILENFDNQTLIHLLISIVILAFFDILSPIFSYLILRIFNTKKKSKDIKNMALYVPIRSFFRLTGLFLAIIYLKPTLGFSDTFMVIATKIYKILVTIATAVGLANSMTKKSRVVKKIKEKSDKDIDDATTKFMVRGIKFLIYAIAVFIIIFEMGYDLSGLITGLGIGSVVLTLAAQDMIKSLLGGFFIFADKPFKVGDFIKFSTYEGTVEDITFRSTKIRTLSNSVVQVPNSLISSSAVENYSKIEKRRFLLNLGIDSDTGLSEIECLKNELYSKFEEMEEIVKDSVVISFNQIKTDELNFQVSLYINIAEFALYVEAKERINKVIIETLKNNNIKTSKTTRVVEIKS